jgi:class 3 adenylate cyclase
VVAQHRGAVVKTIGDAVMAAFVDGADAVRAAAAIQRRFGPEQTLRLRISMHSGPCIAVNLNSGIDYFGSTVNMAAKLQACAEAGEVALSKVVYDAPGVAGALRELGAKLEPAELEHAALDAPMPLYRWTASEWTEREPAAER